MRMLDIGVGTGRTAFTFSAITKEYIGIDYATKMIQQCKNIIQESIDVKFMVLDARNLSKFYENPFDFVLFSLNGIDSVNHESRKIIIYEIRKILKPNGYFFFSTHSLYSFPFQRKAPILSKENILRYLYRMMEHIFFICRIKWIYKGIKIDEIRNRNWCILKDGSHNFKMDIYHIKPSYQVKQLIESGFEIDAVYDENGEVIDPLIDRPNGWIYFLCKSNTE